MSACGPAVPCAASLGVFSIAVSGDVTSSAPEPSDELSFPDSLMFYGSFKWGHTPAREIFSTQLGETWAPLPAPESNTVVCSRSSSGGGKTPPAFS